MTAEVTLREVLDGDLPVFFADQSDPAAQTMAAFQGREYGPFMEHWRDNILGDDTVEKRTILFNGRVAGNIVSWLEGGNRQVGYWIGREFWGQGVATRSLNQFLQLIDSRPLYAHVAKHNVGSIRVLEKCGFRLDGEAEVPSRRSGETVTECSYVLDSVTTD